MMHLDDGGTVNMKVGLRIPSNDRGHIKFRQMMYRMRVMKSLRIKHFFVGIQVSCPLDSQAGDSETYPVNFEK